MAELLVDELLTPKRVTATVKVTGGLQAWRLLRRGLRLRAAEIGYRPLGRWRVRPADNGWLEVEWDLEPGAPATGEVGVLSHWLRAAMPAPTL